jgi:hypothetical protein
MLNLNYNTTFTSLNSQPRAIANFNYSASIVVVGAGGGGASVNGTANPYVPGGGGGAGAAVSASVTIIPNLPYTVIVGQSGSRDMDGSDSRVTGWDGVDSQTLGMFAQGGRKGILSTGGNAGSGSVVRVTTINYPAATGGVGGGSYPNLTAGGGGGALSNGGNGSGAASGNGGTGLTTETVLVAYAAGAGGGAGFNTSNGGAGLTASLNQGGFYEQDGPSATFFGNGGGGAGAEANGGGDSFGGNGSPGAVVFKYSGTQKAFGGTVSYDSGANQTTHLFTSSGQFLYTYPYPWANVPSGSFPQ